MPSTAGIDQASPPNASAPAPGRVARLRRRHWLIESVTPGTAGTLVSLACLDDDHQGEPLEVLWEAELGAKILDEEAWKSIGRRRDEPAFDPPRHFGSFLNTLRWNCVTATDPSLFQAPFRAGISIEPFQLEPLRKALRLPRVNLFIADDVGLGKTIESGLVARELLLRRRVREIVIAAPPSMLLQWKDEMEQRFGLVFEILDREYIRRVREERGFGVNPWETHPRFLISHRLLIDETYARSLRDWLQSGSDEKPTVIAGERAVDIRPGTLLILDEAHHAAPASGARYAIDSRITRAIRDLAPRFEHRLFLSATPHNGHSNSFSSLLNILDDTRFARGIPVRKGDTDKVLVRRLKEDIRLAVGGFPERNTPRIDITVPADAPELVLADLLGEYEVAYLRRFSGADRRRSSEAKLRISGLRQRLLSSIEAFHRTLSKHREGMERIWKGDVTAAARRADHARFTGGFDADEDENQLTEEDRLAVHEQEVLAATASDAGDASAAHAAEERRLLDAMRDRAAKARMLPDGRMRALLDWMREHCCSGIGTPGASEPVPNAAWTRTRVIIFTEYDDTKRQLEQLLRAAIEGTQAWEGRIATFAGTTSPQRREELKIAFNRDPNDDPLRILICTDAAREGLNLQAHCRDLFHFDLPWNPGRLEQRNGRIDRKLQPADKVFCRYFFYPQRPEDRVLLALQRKLRVIEQELGSVGKVLQRKVDQLTKRRGLLRSELAETEAEIDAIEVDAAERATVEEEIESARLRGERLKEELNSLSNILERSRKHLDLDMDRLRDTLDCSLELLSAGSLQEIPLPDGRTGWAVPKIEAREGADSSWADTLDSLRAPPTKGPRDGRWRLEAPVRPIVFEAPAVIDEHAVHLHLEHRLVQRLLQRFMSQGFAHHDLSRACLGQSRDAFPRVILLGRLALYGERAARLHEEIVTVAARWSDPSDTSAKRPLSPFAAGESGEKNTLDMLSAALRPGATHSVPKSVQDRLLASVQPDLVELLPELEARSRAAEQAATELLLKRGQAESAAMSDLLEDQKRRIEKELATYRRKTEQELFEGFADDERRTLEANRRSWEEWLVNVEGDIAREPQRIRDFYAVRSRRLEPIGIAYLWPETGGRSA